MSRVVRPQVELLELWTTLKNDLIRQQLGWSPRYASYREGLEQTLQLWRSNNEVHKYRLDTTHSQGTVLFPNKNLCFTQLITIRLQLSSIINKGIEPQKYKDRKQKRYKVYES